MINFFKLLENLNVDFCENSNSKWITIKPTSEIYGVELYQKIKELIVDFIVSRKKGNIEETTKFEFDESLGVTPDMSLTYNIIRILTFNMGINVNVFIFDYSYNQTTNELIKIDLLFKTGG